MAVVNDKIFFAGGKERRQIPSSIVDIFDTITKEWSTINLPVARYDIGAAAIGSSVIFAGGNKGSEPYKGVDIYDLNTNTLRTLELETTSNSFRSIVLGSKAYFYSIANEILVVDPATNTITQLFSNGQFYGATTNDTHVFFLRSTVLDMMVDVLNPATNILTSLPPVHWNVISRGMVVIGDEMMFLHINGILSVNMHNYAIRRVMDVQFAPDSLSSLAAYTVVGTEFYVIGSGFVSVYSINTRALVRYTSEKLFYGIARSVYHNGIIYYTGSGNLVSSSVLILDLKALGRPLEQYGVSWRVAEGGYLFGAVSDGITYFHLPTNRFGTYNGSLQGSLNVYSAARFGNELLIVGTYNSYSVFNFDTEIWSSNSMPFNFIPTRNAYSDCYVVFIQQDSYSIYIFDIKSREWTRAQFLHEMFASLLLIQDKIVLINDGIDIYDVTTQQWKTIPLDSNLQFIQSSGTLIFFTSKQSSDGTTPRTVLIYDVINDTTQIEQLSIGRPWITSIAAGDLVIFAGGTGAGQNRVDIYNAKTQGWRQFDLLTAWTPRNPPPLSMAVRENIIYFARWNRVDVFDLTTGVTKPLVLPVGQPVSTTVIGSKIIFQSSLPAHSIIIYETSTQSYLSTTFVGSNGQSLITTENFLFISGYNSHILEFPTMLNAISDTQMFVGESTNFTVETLGRNILAHWQHNSTLIMNESQLTLSLSNVAETVSGIYSVEIVDRCSQRMKQQATLTVFSPPVFVRPLKESILLCHESATLHTEVNGERVLFNWTVGQISQTTSKSFMNISGESLECDTSHSFCVTAVNPSGASESCSSIRLVSHDSVFDGPRPESHQTVWFSEMQVTLTVQLLDSDCTNHTWLINDATTGINGTDSSTFSVEITPLITTQSFRVIATCGNSILKSHSFQFKQVTSLTVSGLVLIIVGSFLMFCGIIIAVVFVRRRITAVQRHEVELENLLTQAKSETLKDGITIIQSTTWEWKPTDDFAYRPIDSLPCAIDTSILKSSEKNTVEVNVWAQNEITFTVSKQSKDNKKKKLKERLLSGITVDIYVPESPKYEIKVEPSSFTLEERVPVQVTVSSKMRMTAKCTICLVIVCEQQKVYSVLEYKLESKTSMWIDLDEIETQGDYLGGGG